MYRTIPRYEISHMPTGANLSSSSSVFSRMLSSSQSVVTSRGILPSLKCPISREFNRKPEREINQIKSACRNSCILRASGLVATTI